MQNFETFGASLSRFMQSRNCSMKGLATQMGIKSANTIARIIANKSSTHKIQTFCNEFLMKNPLQLVETEKQELLEALGVSIVGLSAYAANRQMLDFVRERPQQPACVCRQAFGDDCLFVVTLDDLLMSYQDYAHVDIMLQNCALGGVTRAIKTFLEQPGDTKVNIEHYVNTSDEQGEMISDFTCLLDVMGHPNYHFFFSPMSRSSKENELNAYNHILVALKCDKYGNKWTDVVSFYAEDCFDLLHNTAGEATYQFNLQQFRALRIQHNPAKSTYSADFNLHGMCDYNHRLLEMDLQSPLLVIRPDIGLCMVPPDISEAAAHLARKNQNEETDLLFRQYAEVSARRYELFRTSGAQRIYLFSRVGMCYFYKYGKSMANVFGLRDLTLSERRRVIEGILEVARNVPTTAFHLLKNELHYNGISYILYGEKTLFIDSYHEFSNFDLSKSYHSCCIQVPEITQSFSHFATHDLMEHYVHSTDDTIAFLEELLQK